PLIALGLAEGYRALTSSRRAEVSAYLPSILAMCAGNLLLLSSALVLDGLLFLLLIILLADGLSKVVTVWRERSPERFPAIVNALINFACAGLLWYLSRIVGAERAVGFSVGVFVAAAGWRMLMAPPELATAAAPTGAPTIHPNARLGLPPNEAFARMRAE